jgi:hypothetical protein
MDHALMRQTRCKTLDVPRCKEYSHQWMATEASSAEEKRHNPHIETATQMDAAKIFHFLTSCANASTPKLPPP